MIVGWCRCLHIDERIGWSCHFNGYVKAPKIRIYRRSQMQSSRTNRTLFRAPICEFSWSTKKYCMIAGWILKSNGRQILPGWSITPALHTDKVLVYKGAIHAIEALPQHMLMTKPWLWVHAPIPSTLKGIRRAQRRRVLNNIQKSSIASSELQTALSA